MKLSKTMQRIVELLDKDGVEKRQYRRKLEDITGVSYSGISQWFTGETKDINYLHLKAIADYYKVTAEYLMCIDEEKESSQLDKKLISLWNSLDDNQREIALSVFEGAVSGMQKTSQVHKDKPSSRQYLNALPKV